MSQKREFFDIELKDQCKRRMRSIAAMSDFGGIIHDRHESRYFTGSQSWRNPLCLKVSLPEGQRWKYISRTIAIGCGVWLARPERIGVPELMRSHPSIPLRGNHGNCKLRRSYRFCSPAWVRDFHPVHNERLFSGQDVVDRVLDGELELLEHPKTKQPIEDIDRLFCCLRWDASWTIKKMLVETV